MEEAYRGFVIQVEPQRVGAERWTTHFCLTQLNEEKATIWETVCMQNETVVTREYALVVALHTARSYVDFSIAACSFRRQRQP